MTVKLGEKKKVQGSSREGPFDLRDRGELWPLGGRCSWRVGLINRLFGGAVVGAEGRRCRLILPS